MYDGLYIESLKLIWRTKSEVEKLKDYVRNSKNSIWSNLRVLGKYFRDEYSIVR